MDTLKSKREEAIRIVSDLKEQSKVLEENVEKSKTLVAEIVVNTDETKKLNNSLKRITTNTNDALIKFRKERDLVSKLLTQVNNFYEKKYLPLLAKIDDKENGFKARITLSNQNKNEILNIHYGLLYLG